MIRVTSLATVVCLQGYMLQRFLTFHLGRRREAASARAAAEAEAKKAKQDAKKRAAKAKKEEEAANLSELPEVDQNTKTLRQRTTKAK